ncbi:fimbria/pilus outer membrane usher protein [Erwinia sp. HR93]|nr:fimbria/pilus outer membrane usher protein [Erwinia sp. HR93]MEA1063276.1 fimbria/pilus outer membrane usher protein [Erwinia sp. HR93]
MEFNPALLERQPGNTSAVDLSAFERGGQGPGTYHVDVIVNGQIQETRDIGFYMPKDKTRQQTLLPCLSAEELSRYGVNIDAFPELKTSGKCADIAQIPKADATLDFNTQQLLLSIPQAALKTSARGAIDASLWDEGINAFILNYNFTGSNNEARWRGGENSDYQYLNIRPALNIGPWRLRNYTTWNRDSTSGSRWDTIYTYLERDIAALKAQLTLGESNSPSDIFDSVSYRGAQLASDDEMLPDSLKGYAPVVRGIARTNAQVIIRQNGHIIYQSYVAPGAFTISDMYPTGGSGDLYVTVKEADGSEQNMIVPFASVPVLQREGRFKYSVTGGEYRGYRNNSDRDFFSQATGIYGLSHGFTIYGGSQQANRYHSAVGGMGKNLGDLGAVSIDFTQAWSEPKDRGHKSGQSWRIRYSKNFVETGTNFSIAGYRYSTRGYYTLNEVMDTWRDDMSTYLNQRRRNRAELTMSQNLWQGAGALSVGFVSEDYWNDAQHMRSLNVGYNNSWKGITYSLNYSYNRNSSRVDVSESKSYKIYDKDQVLAFNVSIPLSRWLNDTWANYSMNTARHGNTTHTVGLSGTALSDRNLNWNIQEGFTNHNESDSGSSGNMDADYQGTYGELSGGYAWDRSSRRTNYGVAGGIVVHRDGVTLSQPLGETIALVKAPGVSGASVQNEVGVRTDFRGYTVVPYLSAYRSSEVTLNPESLPEDVEIAQTTQKVVPTRGAVVRANFSGRVGQRALVTLLRTNGQPVPFGAVAALSQAQGGAQDKNWSSIVGDSGEVYLSGLQSNGTIDVSWGKAPDARCKAHYQLNTAVKQAVQEINTVCR